MRLRQTEKLLGHACMHVQQLVHGVLTKLRKFCKVGTVSGDSGSEFHAQAAAIAWKCMIIEC
jgi:hypothetical protein